MNFSDATREGSLHSHLFEELPGGQYQLRLGGPVESPKSHTGRKTLNTVRAALIGDKELAKAKREFEKLTKPISKPTTVRPA